MEAEKASIFFFAFPNLEKSDYRDNKNSFIYTMYYLILPFVTGATHNPVVGVRCVKPIKNWQITLTSLFRNYFNSSE
ncbi:MAG: hypothetical protein BWY28_00403 [bacterium ADurb.Bin236]|nr:MAG: hypothetical protein BWY28_00403 [bacterium ADurb.Bin236]